MRAKQAAGAQNNKARQGELLLALPDMPFCQKFTFRIMIGKPSGAKTFVNVGPVREIKINSGRGNMYKARDACQSGSGGKAVRDLRVCQHKGGFPAPG